MPPQSRQNPMTLFHGLRLDQLEKWKHYRDPNPWKFSRKCNKPTILAKGKSQDELKPISEEKLRALKADYMNDPVKVGDNEDLILFAEKHQYVTGKWCVWISGQEGADIWRTMCRDALEGKLPHDVYAVILALIPTVTDMWMIHLKVSNINEHAMRHRIQGYLLKFTGVCNCELTADIAVTLEKYFYRLQLQGPLDAIEIK